MDEYWRVWNIPVHNWLVKHIYVPLCDYGVSKFWGGVSVFFVSAVFHEVRSNTFGDSLIIIAACCKCPGAYFPLLGVPWNDGKCMALHVPQLF